MELEKVLADHIQMQERRFYGKYRGLVASNNDPVNLGRLQLIVPAVLGKDVVTGWALPCTPFGGREAQGFFFIPEKGDGVWVEFEGGDPEFPIWVGTYWSKPKGKNELPKPVNTKGEVQEYAENPASIKMIKTKGHTIQMEEENGKERLLIRDTFGNLIVMDRACITIESKGDINIKGQNINIEAQGKLTAVGNPVHLCP